MKKNSKIISLVLAVVLVFGMLATTALAAGAAAEPTEGGPEIISQNIAYQGTFGLIYAVDAATVKGGSVTVNVYDDGMNFLASYTSSKTEDITPANSEPTLVYVVQTNAVAAKDMGDVFYAQAVDAQGNAGALKSYSVAEYLYERLYANGVYKATEGEALHQKEFYENTLAMGASAQTVLINDKLAEGAPPETLITALNYVYVENGFFDGVSTKLSTEAFSVTPTFDSTCGKLSTGKWNVTRFVDGAETTETVADGTEVSVSGTVIITPVYTDAKGEYYLSSEAGRRLDYDTITTIDSSMKTYSGTVGSYSIVDGSLLFEDGDAESADIGMKFWLSYSSDFTAASNRCEILEFDFKLTQSYGSYPIQIKMAGVTYTLYYSKPTDTSLGTGYMLCMNVDGAYVPLGCSINAWNTIRFEHYYDAAKLKVYVDNEFVFDIASSTGSTGDSPRITLTSNERKTGSNADLYLDNIYVGHVLKDYVAGDPKAAQ